MVLAELSPDLILMDIQLPGEDGLTFTSRLKTNARYRDIPVVALTASALRGAKERGMEAGCDGYITKPIDTRIFSSQIAQILERRRPQKNQ